MRRREFVTGSMALSLVGMTARPMIGADSKGKKSISKGKNMEIKKAGSQPSGKGPADWFTGTVRIDPVWPENSNQERASVRLKLG